MIRYNCDMCGTGLNMDSLIQLDMNCYSKAGNRLTEKTNGIKPEFQLCVDCAYSVYRHIKNRPKRVLDTEDGDQVDERNS